MRDEDDNETAAAQSGTERVLARVLDLAADHLGMDVAWVSEIDGNRYALRATRGDAASFGVSAGDAVAYEGTYCARVLDGRLPNALPDVASNGHAAALAVTSAMGVGAYVGVPIRLGDGAVYGTLCCLSHEADPSVGAKDVKFLQLLAHVAGEELHRERAEEERRSAIADRIREAVRGEGLAIAYQPIVDVASGAVLGAEALARFSAGPPSPATWFAEAAEAGLAEELEIAAIAMALDGLHRLPDGAYLSVNASPASVCSQALLDLLSPDVAGRVQLEITEQAQIDDYDALVAAVGRLRARGVRIAVDDAGAGYASFRHILRLAPDVIKLDMTLTRDVDSDPARHALAQSLVDFSRRVGASLIAEGVETEAELAVLRALGVPAVQGYLLGRPGPLPLQLRPERPRRPRPAAPTPVRCRASSAGRRSGAGTA